MKQLFVAIRATFYATAFVAFFAWIALSVRHIDLRLGVALPSWVRLPGALFAGAGALLVLSCIVVFVRVGRGTPALFDPPVEFVAVGPYRYVRNPMYIGGLGLILGTGLMLRSAAIVCLALVLAVLVHLLVVLYEEPSLGARFQASYRAYKLDVPRWIPRLRGPG